MSDAYIKIAIISESLKSRDFGTEKNAKRVFIFWGLGFELKRYPFFLNITKTSTKKIFCSQSPRNVYLVAEATLQSRDAKKPVEILNVKWVSVQKRRVTQLLSFGKRICSLPVLSSPKGRVFIFKGICCIRFLNEKTFCWIHFLCVNVFFNPSVRGPCSHVEHHHSLPLARRSICSRRPSLCK
jgi:hypothetical protein